MKLRKSLLIIGILIIMINVGCATFVTTNWLAETPFDQGILSVFMGQEKMIGSAITPNSYGSVSISLNASERIKDINFLTSEVMLRFLKDGNIVKEQKIFPEPYYVDKNNKIIGVIGTYSKYTTPGKGKQYSLNWDEVMEVLKVTNRIECSIDLKFEANGKLYSIQKVVELMKDIKKEIVWGIVPI